MATYEEVYGALESLRKRYLALPAGVSSRQNQRYLRISTIAEIFMEQVQGLQGEIENEIVDVKLSLEGLMDALYNSRNLKVSKETLVYDIRGIALDTNAGYQLADRIINPSRTAKRR